MSAQFTIFKHGGNAIWSTGYLAFCDFAMQHEAGISDSVDAFLADAAAEVDRQRDRYGIVWDRELTRLYAERSSATFDFLRRYGVTFERFIRRPQQHTIDRMVERFEQLYLAEIETHVWNRGNRRHSRVAA